MNTNDIIKRKALRLREKKKRKQVFNETYKVIKRLSKRKKEVRVRDIAKELNIARRTALRRVKAMEKQSLVELKLVNRGVRGRYYIIF